MNHHNPEEGGRRHRLLQDESMKGGLIARGRKNRENEIVYANLPHRKCHGKLEGGLVGEAGSSRGCVFVFLKELLGWVGLGGVEGGG